MATKKQKHEAALARRAKFLEEEKARGLEAQKRDRESRKKRESDVKKIADEINQRHAAILQRQMNRALLEHSNAMFGSDD